MDPGASCVCGQPAFRGGGKACSVDTRHSWRTAATPQVSRAKSAQSHTSQWRPTSTPKTVKGKSKTLTAKEPSRHAWRCVATPSATAKSDRRHDPASSRPAPTRADPEAGSGAVKAGLSEQFVWTCNLCKQVLRYTNKRSLSCGRRRHVQKAHPKKKKLVAPCFPRRNTCLDPHCWGFRISSLRSKGMVMPKMSQGLPSMKQHLLKKSRDKHIMQCYGYTKAKFESFDIAIRHGSKPIWKLTETMLQKLSRKQRMRSKPIMSALQLDLFAFRPHSPELKCPFQLWHLHSDLSAFC